MSGTPDEAEVEPLMKPHLVRFLKDRPRLVDQGVRREFLEELDRQMCHRRRPDTAAEKAVDAVFDRAREAGSAVAKHRARNRLVQANRGPLEML